MTSFLPHGDARILHSNAECDRPPPGWCCTRTRGHDGPCAALPTPGMWTAQVNDLVGGWCVTNYPHPLSEHDFRKEGNPARRGYVMADDFYCRQDAEVVAKLLNEAGVTRQLEGPDVR